MTSCSCVQHQVFISPPLSSTNSSTFTSRLPSAAEPRLSSCRLWDTSSAAEAIFVSLSARRCSSPARCMMGSMSHSHCEHGKSACVCAYDKRMRYAVLTIVINTGERISATQRYHHVTHLLLGTNHTPRASNAVPTNKLTSSKPIMLHGIAADAAASSA